jgi:hypothetical protein
MGERMDFVDCSAVRLKFDGYAYFNSVAITD